MTEPSQPTPEQDYAIAREALLAGDHAHALRHVAGALAGDPLRPEWLVLLDQIGSDAGDVLALVPMEKGIWFGTAAVRARLLASVGRIPEALDLLLQASATNPVPPYLAWAAEWIAGDDAAREVSASDVAASLRVFVSAFVKEPCPLASGDPRRRSIAYAAEVAERLRKAHPDSGPLCEVHSQLLRRLGRTAEAIEAASRGRDLSPGWTSAVMLAGALREAGRTDDAIASYREAAAFDPSDVSATLDVGDLQLEAGRFAEAAATYAGVLAREPHHPWAEPSHVYACLRAGMPAPPRGLAARVAAALRREQPGWLERLRALAPSNPRAEELVAELEPAEDYVNRLPGSAEASINLLRKLVADHGGGAAGGEGEAGGAGASNGFQDLRITVSALEAPSVRIAFAMQLRVVGITGRVSFEVQRLQEPDPRVPRRPVRWQLWRYQGNEPEPVPSPPPDLVRIAVSRLAGLPYRLLPWSREAGEIARRLGESSVPDLLGAMVHPPDPPSPQLPADAWIERLQIAAALIVSRLPGPWPGSLRRAVLLDLLDGLHDWTIGAAALALGDVAVREPDARRDVERAFHDRMCSMPKGGHVGWDHPLVCAYQRLPGLDPATADHLRRYRAALETQGE